MFEGGERKNVFPQTASPPSNRSSFERQQSQRGGIRQLQRNCCLCCISLFSLLPSSPSPLSCLDRAPLLATFGQFHGLTVAPSSSSSSETAAGRRLGKTGGGRGREEGEDGRQKKKETEEGKEEGGKQERDLSLICGVWLSSSYNSLTQSRRFKKDVYKRTYF